MMPSIPLSPLPPDGLARVPARPAVAHLHQQVDDQPLEESRRAVLDRLQQLRRQPLPHALVRGLDLLLGCLGLVDKLLSRLVAVVRVGRLELHELWKPLEVARRDLWRARRQDVLPFFRDPVVAAARRLE